MQFDFNSTISGIRLLDFRNVLARSDHQSAQYAAKHLRISKAKAVRLIKAAVEAGYLSNGCRACGHLLGNFYIHDARYDQPPIAAFPQRLTGPWYDAVVRQLACERAPMAWGVYED